MKFEYLAHIQGGKGPDVWDSEITIFAENLIFEKKNSNGKIKTNQS